MKDGLMLGATKSLPLTVAFTLLGVAGVASPAKAADEAPPSAAVAPAAPAPAVPLPAPSAAVVPAPPVEEAPVSWFARAPLTVGIGEGSKRWSITFSGFVEADYIYDSTRSYGDAMGGELVARSDTYDGNNARTQFSMRNTRLGMAFESPTVGGVKPTAVLEGDFFGNQPSSATEATFFSSPTFRVRHAYLKLQNDYVDVVAGQTYDVFGWQNNFAPCTLEFLGLPNQVFSRNMQLRLSHAFGAEGPVAVEVAASAVRPAQRDSGVPDVNGGLRLNVNGWKGISTPGNTGTTALPLSIGVSGVARQFKANAFAPPPVQNSNNATGWGVSVDALIPLIPAHDAFDRGNKLTITGSFVTGTGIADLITAGGGATFPALFNPAQGNPAPIYTSNVDNGLVSFDVKGVVHTIDWQAVRVGFQYYLPPMGRVILAANYTMAKSKNMKDLFPKGGAEIELLGRVADKSSYFDASLLWDATPAVRVGVSGQYTKVEYLDGDKPHNVRAMGQALYAF